MKTYEGLDRSTKHNRPEKVSIRLFAEKLMNKNELLSMPSHPFRQREVLTRDQQIPV